MQQKIVCFIGSQGSGKTTTQLAVFEKLKENGRAICQYYGIKSVSKDAINLGFQINENTTFQTQYYIAVRYIVADIETRMMAAKNNVDWIILDRSVLDVIPYTRACPNITEKQKELIHNMIYDHYKLFPVNYLFYLKPLKNIENDGIRSVDKEFQKVIDHYFKELLDIELEANYSEISDIPLEKRVDEVLALIQPNY